MVRVRFAPSPTGRLHQGNIRTALYNYFFAKQNNGSFVLRIDDTDKERSKEEFTESILHDLKWLGIQPNEGHSFGGEYQPYRQSERGEIYKKHLDQLLESGRVYPCFSTPEEVEVERRRALAAGKTFVYQPKDRDFTPEERQQHIDEGKTYHFRFRVDREIIKFNDLVYGEKIFDTVSISDFTVARSDGSPLYLFASAVDDALMKITHVIRGEDGMSNSPRQILIQRALGFEPPQFAHLPLILGPDHTLLSKRNGSADLDEMKAKGYLPQAITNYLSLLGWAPPEGKEILSLEELVKLFRLDRVSRSSAIFDWDKLNFINNTYLRQLNDEEYLKAVSDAVNQGGHDLGSNEIKGVVLALRPNVKSPSDLPTWIKLLLEEPKLKGEEADQVFSAKETAKVYPALLEGLAPLSDPISLSQAEALLEEVKKKSKVKGRKLFMPIRIALTGHTEGPELTQLFQCLGKQRIEQRVQRATENIQHS